MSSQSKYEIIEGLKQVPIDSIWGVGISKAVKSARKIPKLIKQLQSQAIDDYSTMASILGPELTDKILEYVSAASFKDLRGQKFGKLTPIKRIGSDHGTAKWLCACDCGNEKITTRSLLLRGMTQSCGCKTLVTHGLSKTPFYAAWVAMKMRTNPNRSACDGAYKTNGIGMCERWRRFENFYEDMFPTYRPGLTLDRRNNKGNYEPGNCRWATMIEQNRNKGDTAYYTIEGITRCLSEWCAIYKMKQGTVSRRLGKGLQIIEALTRPVNEAQSLKRKNRRIAWRITNKKRG